MGEVLPLSKSPVLDALVYCALNGWGIQVYEDVTLPAEKRLPEFYVTDFTIFMNFLYSVNSKNRFDLISLSFFAPLPLINGLQTDNGPACANKSASSLV